MPSDRVNEYLKSVCAEVRWRQAHDAVREELAAHIEAFTAAYNKTARPFVWKKREIKGSQLKDNIRNFSN